MKHVRSVPLGVRIGSLTWVERRGGYWWAGFANYDVWGGEAGHDHRYSVVVKFDSEWRQVGGYRFPDSVLERFAPTSDSGGSWGDDGLLYVTGHDRSEIYVLREPGEGTTLEPTPGASVRSAAPPARPAPRRPHRRTRPMP